MAHAIDPYTWPIEVRDIYHELNGMYTIDIIVTRCDANGENKVQESVFDIKEGDYLWVKEEHPVKVVEYRRKDVHINDFEYPISGVYFVLDRKVFLHASQLSNLNHTFTIKTSYLSDGKVIN